MKKFGGIVILMISIFCCTLYSCKKSRIANRDIEIEFTGDLSYHDASFKVSYRNRYKRDKFTNVGICWSIEPNPTYFYKASNMAPFTAQLTLDNSEGEEYFLATNLHANTTYFVRAYMEEKDDDYVNENNFVYSSEIKVETENLPDCPCSVNINIVNFSGIDRTMLNGNLAQNDQFSNTVEFLTASDQGDFKFQFTGDPLSGIYKTYKDQPPYGEPNAFYTKLSCHLPSVYNCEYFAEDGQDIYVINDGLGNVSISFCQITILTDDPCSEQYIISGEIRNY